MGKQQKQAAKITETVERKRKTAFLLLAAFLEGAMVVVVELLGTKMLIPYLGNSLTIWTSVIGITIAFLAIGYYIGGMLSRKKNLLHLLSLCFSFAALLIVIMPAWSVKLLEMNMDESILYASIFTTILLIGPPILLLGISSPLIIQYLTAELADSGKNAGNVYAVSTIGGILFTLILGMYVLPEWGITLPVAWLSLLLLLFSFIVSFSRIQFVVIVLFALFFIRIFTRGSDENGTNSYSKIKYISEGLMGQLKVVDEYDPRDGLPYRMLLINGICQTKIVNNKEIISAWNYVHQVSMLASFRRGGDALLLGMGGGSIASELNRLEFKTDIVDIDERMFDIAQDYFYFNDSSSAFHVDDARHFVRTTSKKYDVVVLDVLNGETQPVNIFTREGLHSIQKVLKPDGLCIVEFQEKINRQKTSAYQSICNTFLDAGFKVKYHVSEFDIADVIIVASLKENSYAFEEIKPGQISSSFPFLGPVAEVLKIPFKTAGKAFKNGVVLTDDLPVLELINAETIRYFRKTSNENYAGKHLKEQKSLFK